MPHGTGDPGQCSIRRVRENRDETVTACGTGRLRRGRVRLIALGAGVLAMAGCSQPSSRDWYGYAYPDLMSNLTARVSGPYKDGQQCLAAMHAMEQTAQPPRPITAGYACARGCRFSTATGDSGQLLVSDCDEARR